MNMLKKLFPLRVKTKRLLETNGPTVFRKVVVEPLVDRELIRVRGEEVQQFLQGLTTNNIFQLNKPASSIYAMFLNKAGRVLYDTIIYRTAESNSYIIECDKNVTTELKRHLRLYRVRRKIDIDSIDMEFTPWVVFNPEHIVDHNLLSPEEWFFTPDPRLGDLGLRLLMTPNKTWTDLVKVFSKPGEVGINVPTTECNYRLHRLICGVGEGIIDMPPGKCFALESNVDFLNGVNFQKGCYIGQELTARTYHTGVIRKRLMPVRLTVKGAEKGSAVQILSGANIGILRESYQNRGLALMRVENALNYKKFLVDGELCYVEKPNWWPKELRFKASVARSN